MMPGLQVHARALKVARPWAPPTRARVQTKAPVHAAVPRYLRRSLPISRTAAAAAAAAAAADAGPTASKAPVVVWFKHDLRTRDHPGLTAALASGRPAVAFFCFDPHTLSDQLTHLWGPAAVHGAIVDLKKRLAELNCPLVVRTGDTKDELLKLVAETGAEEVSCQSEVEQQWLEVEQAVQTGLPAAVALKQWRAPIWPATAYAERTFKEFTKKRGASLEDIPTAPPAQPDSAPAVDAGAVPSLADVRSLLEASVAPRFAAGAGVTAPDVELVLERGWVYDELADVVTGGETEYQRALSAYLRGPNASDALTERVKSVTVRLEDVPGNESGSFTALFQPALALGMLSHRQVYLEARRVQREKDGGIDIPDFLALAAPTTRAALKVSECGDWHTGLAHAIRERPTQASPAQRRFWRWNGQMVDYLIAEPAGGMKSDTQTILLVHGFGAFAEHWRRNVPALAEQGFRVLACTLPGFGPSEKSPQVYTTAFWKAYVRDFVVNVVRTPVIVAGNSIGGVIPANACADHPPLFDGIVLINTAGSDDPDYDPEEEVPEKNQRKVFVNVTAWLVFTYLQGGISKQLERLYPARPFNADRFLNDEIYRASCDPCALQVLRSGFYLKPPRALPYMLNELYSGPVLILQGVLDPLNKARDRADRLDAAIPKATKVCIDGGHCPHDEVPELVNEAIVDFARSLRSEGQAERGSEEGERSAGAEGEEPAVALSA